MFWCFLFDQFSFFPGYNMMIPPFSWGNTAIFHVFRSSPPVSPRPAAVWGVDGNHFWALAAWEIRNHFPWQPGMEHRHGTFISRFFLYRYLSVYYIYIYTLYILYIYIYVSACNSRDIIPKNLGHNWHFIGTGVLADYNMGAPSKMETRFPTPRHRNFGHIPPSNIKHTPFHGPKYLQISYSNYYINHSFWGVVQY